jgi:hypothetical protein
MMPQLWRVLAAMAISSPFKFELGKLARVRAIQGEYIVAIKNIRRTKHRRFLADVGMTFVLATTIAVAIGEPTIAMAQAERKTGSILCRPAKAGKTANANLQNTPFICEQSNVERIPDAAPVGGTNVNGDWIGKEHGTKGASRPYGNLPYPGFDGNPND